MPSDVSEIRRAIEAYIEVVVTQEERLARLPLTQWARDLHFVKRDIHR
jgi:hypothetical protein